MQIILKPMGAVVVLAALGVLSVVALGKGGPVSAASSTGAATSLAHSPSPAARWIPNAAWQFVSPNADAAAVRHIPQATRPGQNTDIVQVSVHTPMPTEFWKIGIQQPIDIAVASHQPLVLHFRARSQSGGQFVAVVEKASPDWTKQVIETVDVGHNWTEYSLPFRTDTAYSAGSLHVCLQFGLAAGEYEVTDISLQPA